MASIIDDIYNVERLIENIQATGRKEIREIYSVADQKDKEMQRHFADEFIKESKIMEDDMFARIDKHEKSLKEDFKDQYIVLQESMNSRKEKFRSLLINEFWKQ